MKITFNQLGIITETDYTDESLRQGNIGNHLIAKFENKSNVDYVATFNFTRSDGTRIKDILMVAGDESDEFKYTFNNLWFFAKYGITTITIFLRQNGEIVAQGQIQFNIEQTDFDENVEITYDQYQALIDSIADLSTYSLGSISDAEILNGLQDGVNTFVWNGEDSSPFTNGTSYFIFTNREESQTIISANGDLFTIATREYISENEYGDWNITSFGANSFYTKAESDARYYTKADTYSKVESDLRYYTKSEIIANYATKSYVDNEVQNVREVAEGKCKTYIISCDEGIAPTDETEFGEDAYYYPDGTQIETWQDYQTFTNGLYCSNDDFNDQDNAINITASYIITDENKVIPLNSTYLHKGDNVLVIQTNVPDRWYDGRYTMYALETSKVDLDDYARLSLPNTFYGNNIFNGTSFFDNDVEFEQDVSFAGEITSNFVPKTSNTYDLGLDNGTTIYTWKNLHLSGSIYLYGLNYNGFITNNSNRIQIGYSGSVKFEVGNADATFYVVLRPSSDNSIDIGQNNRRVRDLYLSRNLTDGTNSLTIADIYSTLNPLESATTIIKWRTFCSFELSADTTLTLETEKVGCANEYKGSIKNTSSSSINITLPSQITKMLCNDDSITFANDVLTLPANTEIEYNILGATMVVINWDAQ